MNEEETKKEDGNDEQGRLTKKKRKYYSISHKLFAQGSSIHGVKVKGEWGQGFCEGQKYQINALEDPYFNPIFLN